MVCVESESTDIVRRIFLLMGSSKQSICYYVKLQLNTTTYKNTSLFNLLEKLKLYRVSYPLPKNILENRIKVLCTCIVQIREWSPEGGGNNRTWLGKHWAHQSPLDHRKRPAPHHHHHHHAAAAADCRRPMTEQQNTGPPLAYWPVVCTFASRSASP